MAQLVTLLSYGKGTWNEVLQLIKQDWDKVYLLCNEFAYKTVEINQKNVIKIQIPETINDTYIEKLTSLFKKQLQHEFDVAVNITSGTGKEHMAMLNAILKAGVGLRFVGYENNEIKEYKLLNETYPEDEELND
jgi:hypothetical protein